MMLKKQSKYEETKVMHQQTLKERKKVLESEHLNTLISIDNLGLVLKKQNKYKETEVMH